MSKRSKRQDVLIEPKGKTMNLDNGIKTVIKKRFEREKGFNQMSEFFMII